MPSDVLLGHSGDRPVYLPYGHRTAHVAILGKSRYGKTTLLEHLVLTDMQAGTAAIVVDAHGDLSRRLVTLADGRSRDRIVLVEPNTDRAFGLNIYECPDRANPDAVTRTVDNVVDIFNKLMGQEGSAYRPYIDQGLRNTARVLIANGYTMAELPLLYTDAVFREAALHALPMTTHYWQEYEQSDPRRRQEKREPVLNRVARFLEDGLIAPMVSQARTTIPIQQVLNEGRTLLFNLSGLARETTSFLGMVFLSVLTDALEQRAQILKGERKRVHLYLDEYGRFATPATQRMIHELGKHEVGITIAHQSLSQTPEREALSVETLIVFQLSGDDAKLVSQQLDVNPVRVRTRLQQSTEPQYNEWDEEVWISDTTRNQYEQLCRKRDAATAKASRSQRILYLLDKALNSESHFSSRVDHRRTYSYDGNFPVKEICGGMSVTEESEMPIKWHKAFNPYGGYIEDMAESPEDCTDGGLIWYSTLFEAYFLKSVVCYFSWFRWVVDRAAENDDDRELLKPFIDEVPNILALPYAHTQFRFIVTDYFAGPAHNVLGTERSRSGPFRAWPVQGAWCVESFPAAVVWLANRITTLQSDLDRAQRLATQCQVMHATNCKMEHRKEYIGEKPVTQEIWESGRGNVTQPLYHFVEEPAQSSADRVAEVANSLTQLPRYVAYCKLPDDSGHMREHRIQAVPPAVPDSLSTGESTWNIVRSRSRNVYGRRPDEIARLAEARKQPPRIFGPPPVDLAQQKAREENLHKEEARKQRESGLKPPSITRRSPRTGAPSD
ncbi:type IV secretory system conjugative DNA transfer family protein [Streptomyces sp. NPDC093514]|uniref:type IV secretory system conjugative DNA transfer family protein n=1 Tax=Streptomyces sp. NPDC093514 TaxID=3366039 RepID=UPI003825DB40